MSVNSVNFCSVLVLLMLCLGNRIHWNASTRDSLHKTPETGKGEKALIPYEVLLNIDYSFNKIFHL